MLDFRLRLIYLKKEMKLHIHNLIICLFISCMSVGLTIDLCMCVCVCVCVIVCVSVCACVCVSSGRVDGNMLHVP